MIQQHVYFSMLGFQHPKCAVFNYNSTDKNLSGEELKEYLRDHDTFITTVNKRTAVDDLLLFFLTTKVQEPHWKIFLDAYDLHKNIVFSLDDFVYNGYKSGSSFAYRNYEPKLTYNLLKFSKGETL